MRNTLSSSSSSNNSSLDFHINIQNSNITYGNENIAWQEIEILSWTALALVAYRELNGQCKS